jgi:ATP-dependent Lon protease
MIQDLQNSIFGIMNDSKKTQHTEQDEQCDCHSDDQEIPDEKNDYQNDIEEGEIVDNSNVTEDKSNVTSNVSSNVTSNVSSNVSSNVTPNITLYDKPFDKMPTHKPFSAKLDALKEMCEHDGLKDEKTNNEKTNNEKTNNEKTNNEKTNNEKTNNVEIEKPPIIAKENFNAIKKYFGKKNYPQFIVNQFNTHLDAYIAANPITGDVSKLKSWLGYAIKIPNTCKITNISQTPENIVTYIDNIRDILNKNIYGMKDAKEELLEFILHRISNPKASKILGLCGPPGIGKTELCRALAEILDLPIVKIPLGGVHDASTLIGHNMTYIGALPGKIARGLIEAQYKNPIIFCDEIDKVSDRHNNEINGVITHLIDETQNKEFIDEYIEFPIDLSSCLFVFAFNDIEKLDHIVRDRMDVIFLSGYTSNDKLQIAKHHLVPRELANVGFAPTDIIIPDDIIMKMISSENVNESGVRNLKRHIQCIAKRLNAIKLTNNNYFECKLEIASFTLPYTVTSDDYLLLKKERNNKKTTLSYYL